MLRSNAKNSVPFLCCCFWTIIFSVFLNFFSHLVTYTHTKIGEEEWVCWTDIPLQNQYQLVKKEYTWRGVENITNAVLRQPCPDSQVRVNIYYTGSYIGGIQEIETDTFIFNCKNEIIFTFSNLTLYDSSREIVGTLDFKDNPLVLTNPGGELVAQWYLGSKNLTFVVYSEVVDRVLLFSIAGKYAFGEYNECATKYWMSLQIVLISAILSIASMVMGIIMCRMRGKDSLAFRRSSLVGDVGLRPYREVEPRKGSYSRKKFNLKILN